MIFTNFKIYEGQNKKNGGLKSILIIFTETMNIFKSNYSVFFLVSKLYMFNIV